MKITSLYLKKGILRIVFNIFLSVVPSSLSTKLTCVSVKMYTLCDFSSNFKLLNTISFFVDIPTVDVPSKDGLKCTCFENVVHAVREVCCYTPPMMNRLMKNQQTHR